MMVNKIVNEFSSSLYIHVIYHSVVTLVIRPVIEMTFIFNGHKTGLPVNVAHNFGCAVHVSSRGFNKN